MKISKSAPVLKWSLVALLLILLSGCQTRFVYNHLDWWLNWQIGKVVDLNNQQKILVDAEFTELLDWHRNEEIPYYIELLKTYRAAVINKDEALLVEGYQQTKLLWVRAITKFAPAINRIIETLSERQRHDVIDNLRSIQEDQHEQWREDRASTSEQELLEERLERYEELLGQLTPYQVELITELDRNLSDTMELRIASRENWLMNFEKVLLSKNSELSKSAMLDVLSNITKYRSVQHIKQSKHNEELYIKWVGQMLLSLEPKQADSILEKIDGYIEDLEIIIEP